MKYILASDYDGTLSQGGTISEETKEAIKKFRRLGHLFGVVTGRDYVKGFEVFKRENKFEFDFIIASNGSAAYDKDGNIYFAECIKDGRLYGKTTLAQNLIKRCLQLSSNPCGISFERARFDFHPDYLLGATVDNKTYTPLSVLEDVDEFVMANAACKTAEETVNTIKALKSEFGRYINPIQNGRCIDISPAGIDKSAGVERLAQCLGIPHENIWTAGDNFNDITMLKNFHGCAMANAVTDAIDVAEYVCNDVAEVIKIILDNQ